MELFSLLQGNVVRYGGGALVTVLLMLWLYWRSGSNHILFSRLWSIVQGKAQPGDRPLRLFLARRSTLMQFRTITGVRCRTIVQAHELLKWTQENNEEIGDVARCGNFFDLETPCLKDERPKKWQFWLAIGFVAACVIALVFTGGLSLSERAWVSVKNGSGAQLLVSSTDVEVHKTYQYFSKDDCTKQDHTAIASRVGIPPNEVDTACGWFRDDAALKADIHRLVGQQRTAAAVLAIIILGYGTPTFRWLTSVMASVDMRERLEKLKEKQPTSPNSGAKPKKAPGASDADLDHTG